MERDGKMIDGLMRLGFSDVEARTYEALTRAQPATAYALSKLSGLPRANSYGAVSSLTVRGAIRAVSVEPVRYAVADARTYFAGLARTVADTVGDVEGRVAAASATARADFVETVEGRPAVATRVAAAIETAATHLHLKTTDALAAPYLDSLAAAVDRGVAVTIVASGEDWGDLARRDGVAIVPHEGTGSTPSEPHQILLTLVTDAGEAVVADLGEPSRAYVAANPALVYVIRTMILHEVYLAEIATALGPDVLAAAGVGMATLRARFRPSSHGLNVARPAGPNRRTASS